jgi:hypothetical protein
MKKYIILLLSCLAFYGFVDAMVVGETVTCTESNGVIMCRTRNITVYRQKGTELFWGKRMIEGLDYPLTQAEAKSFFWKLKSEYDTQMQKPVGEQ